MKWIFQYQLFLFDFDGLLVDTEKLHFQAYQQMCQMRGCTLPWDFSTFCHFAHGSASGLKDAIYALFPQVFVEEPRWEVLYKEKKQAYEHLLDKGVVELMPGAEDLLLALDQSKIKRCVVTNSSRKQIETIRQHVPALQTISYWITREDYEHPKPAPDGYLKAIALLGSQGDRIIGFEDSLKGLQSLLAAGVEGVLINPNEKTSLGAHRFDSMVSMIEHFHQK